MFGWTGLHPVALPYNQSSGTENYMSVKNNNDGITLVYITSATTLNHYSSALRMAKSSLALDWCVWTNLLYPKHKFDNDKIPSFKTKSGSPKR